MTTTKQSRHNTGAVAAVLCAAVLLAAAPSAASVGSAPPIRHVGVHDEIEWAGHITTTGGGDVLAQAGPPVEATCDDATAAGGGCDVITLQVTPATGWDRLVVAADYRDTVNGFDLAYDLSLHVYGPDGSLVGSSVSPFTGQVVTVDKVVAGTYQAVVTGDAVIGTLPYKGYAALAKSPRHHPHRDLVPNLVAQPPARLQVASAPYSTFPPFVSDFRNVAKGPTSCYVQETLERGARRCLRFDQSIANLGPGPLELRAVEVADGAAMRQRVYRNDGSWRERDAGEARFHLQHGHFHYRDYAQAVLYASDAAGTRGPAVRVGFKQGFCMADVDNMRFGRRDQVQPRYLGPGLCDGQEEITTSRVGISSGWADTYPWYMGDQFIEISDIADGIYLLEVAVNGTGALKEASFDDNSAATLFRLFGDRVEVLRFVPADEWSR